MPTNSLDIPHNYRTCSQAVSVVGADQAGWDSAVKLTSMNANPTLAGMAEHVL